MTKPTPKAAEYSPDLQSLVVPGREHTMESLIAELDRIRKRKQLTPYSIAKRCGMEPSIQAVSRLFKGYAGAGQVTAERVSDPERVGRVQLSTFLDVVHAMGYDVEIVSRSAPSRD